MTALAILGHSVQLVKRPGVPCMRWSSLTFGVLAALLPPSVRITSGEMMEGQSDMPSRRVGRLPSVPIVKSARGAFTDHARFPPEDNSSVASEILDFGVISFHPSTRPGVNEPGKDFAAKHILYDMRPGDKGCMHRTRHHSPVIYNRHFWILPSSSLRSVRPRAYSYRR